MTVLNDRTSSLLHAQVRALGVATGRGSAPLPATTGLTKLMAHGGLYTLLDPEMMSARIGALKASGAPGAHLLDAAVMATAAQTQLSYFFYHLVPKPYEIHSDLISYLSFPHEGQTYSDRNTNTPSPTRLPAAFTFMGQFIDHDLTMNAMDLFVDQSGAIQSGASPLIDLDSVYGPRRMLAHIPEAEGAPQDAAPLGAVFDGKRFKLRAVHEDDDPRKPIVGYDYPRDPSGMAMIPDARDDENEILAQVQILLMRLHNSFANAGSSFEDAKRETLYSWQSVVLNDYLPRVAGATTTAAVRAAMDSANFKALHHRPLEDPATGELTVGLPHEFAIAFRFGHSQLRSGYSLNPGSGVIPLFINQAANPDDLRGGGPLKASHVVDWSYFLLKYDGTNPATVSNQIDTKVTAAVFDLPESAIPDDITYIGNLAQRNLVRSRQVGVASGEDVADVFGVPAVPADLIESDPQKRRLFRNPKTGKKQATPLWYYVLKEAELAAEGKIASPDGKGFLGPLGARLVAEVVAGAVYWAPENFTKDKTWTSRITGKRELRFEDIVQHVLQSERPKQPAE